MKRIIFFPIAAMLVGLLSNSCKKEDPRGRYVGTYRCSYKETMWSSTYGSYVLKDLSDTIINITPSSRYEDGVDILFFSFTIDVDGKILKGYGNSPGGFYFYLNGITRDWLYVQIDFWHEVQ